MASTFTKDPDAILDYVFDWSTWLADSETISSYTITTESGITLDSNSGDDTSVTVWVSGGVAIENYTVSCCVTTNASRTDERSITIKVRER